MTAQLHERIIVDDEEISMAFCPPFPDDHPRIYKPNPGEAISWEDDFIFMSSGCWRGYQGTWQIKDGHLYLIELQGCFQIRGDDAIFAEWFTGSLLIPKGKILRYIHMGFGTIYEQEIHIKVENGIVINTRIIDNRNTKLYVMKANLSRRET